MFQTHYPARGRKLESRNLLSSSSMLVSNPLPRKGTETLKQVQNLLSVQSARFKPITPQGDGNNRLFRFPNTLTQILFQTHYPARGRKHEDHFTPILSRNGGSFKPITPQGDGNQHNLLCVSKRHYNCFKPITPQGDGNRSRLT